MADLAFRVQAVIKTEVDVTEAQLSRNGIDVVHGIARFAGPNQVRVEGIQTDTRSTPTGSSGRRHQTRILLEVPVNGRTIVNSDQVLDLAVLPRTLIVVGGA